MSNAYADWRIDELDRLEAENERLKERVWSLERKGSMLAVIVEGQHGSCDATDEWKDALDATGGQQ